MDFVKRLRAVKTRARQPDCLPVDAVVAESRRDPDRLRPRAKTTNARTMTPTRPARPASRPGRRPHGRWRPRSPSCWPLTPPHWPGRSRGGRGRRGTRRGAARAPVPAARWDAPAVLVRPDQHAAWRGAEPGELAAPFRRAAGHADNDSPAGRGLRRRHPGPAPRGSSLGWRTVMTRIVGLRHAPPATTTPPRPRRRSRARLPRAAATARASAVSLRAREEGANPGRPSAAPGARR